MKKIVNTTPPESISLQEVSDNFMGYTVFAKYKNDFYGLVILEKATSKYYLNRGVWDKESQGNGYLTLQCLIETYDTIEFYAQKDITVHVL